MAYQLDIPGNHSNQRKAGFWRNARLSAIAVGESKPSSDGSQDDTHELAGHDTAFPPDPKRELVPTVWKAYRCSTAPGGQTQYV